jgi:hypothetical protein
MENLVAENIDFVSAQRVLTSDIFVVCRVLGNKSALLEKRSMFCEFLFLCEYLDISEQFGVGNAGKRVLDSINWSVNKAHEKWTRNMKNKQINVKLTLSTLKAPIDRKRLGHRFRT